MKKDTWNPEQYDKFKQQRSQPFYDLMNLLEPTPGDRVIDLGCGPGNLTSELHQFVKASETIGVDSSDEMLKKAQEFAGSGLSFEKKDINQWKEKNGFDIIFSNAALQWCLNHEGLFQNLKESLRPEGQLAVQMPMNHDYPTHVLADKMSREDRWKNIIKNDSRETTVLTVEQYASLLFKLGFKEQKVMMKVYGHVLDSREGVIEWVKGTMLTHYEAILSPENFQKFVAEFRERLFLELPDEKPFFYPFKRVLIWAK